MPDTSTHLLLPYLLSAQAQKHVTVNEALRLLDGLVQLAVLDRHLTAPPVSPADGARYIVATGATGAWSGWDLNVAYWVDGAWMRLVPRSGWQAWVVDEATFLAWLDFRALDLAQSPQRFFLDHARVALAEGLAFGEPGRGFARLNFGTSRPILDEILARMDAALRARDQR